MCVCPITKGWALICPVRAGGGKFLHCSFNLVGTLVSIMTRQYPGAADFMHPVGEKQCYKSVYATENAAVSPGEATDMNV